MSSKTHSGEGSPPPTLLFFMERSRREKHTAGCYWYIERAYFENSPIVTISFSFVPSPLSRSVSVDVSQRSRGGRGGGIR